MPEKKVSYILWLLKENFSNISAKEKSFLYSPYNEGNFSKLKYFLIIVKKTTRSTNIFGK